MFNNLIVLVYQETLGCIRTFTMKEVFINLISNMWTIGSHDIKLIF